MDITCGASPRFNWMLQTITMQHQEMEIGRACHLLTERCSRESGNEEMLLHLSSHFPNCKIIQQHHSSMRMREYLKMKKNTENEIIMILFPDKSNCFLEAAAGKESWGIIDLCLLSAPPPPFQLTPGKISNYLENIQQAMSQCASVQNKQ